jgi:hypothetical protein
MAMGEAAGLAMVDMDWVVLVMVCCFGFVVQGP